MANLTVIATPQLPMAEYLTQTRVGIIITKSCCHYNHNHTVSIMNLSVNWSRPLLSLTFLVLAASVDAKLAIFFH